MPDWYVVTNIPSDNSDLVSSVVREEFVLIETQMAKLPDYTGNADKIAVINSGGTGMTVITSITVGQGGTGLATITDGAVMLGSGTAAITPLVITGDGEMIVGDGAGDPVIESGATLRTSLGLAIGTAVQAYDVDASKLDVAETRAAGVNFADNTLTRPVILDYAIKTNAIGAIGGGAQTIDLELGNSVTATVDTSETTFTFSNPAVSDEECGFTLYLTNGGSQTVNWPAATVWDSGNAPSLTAAGVDILVFTTVDGGTIWNGVLVSSDSS